MEIGKSHTSYLTVDETNTAIAIGSGDMPVLATPAMMARKDAPPWAVT